jgi:hypothetical protein
MIVIRTTAEKIQLAAQVRAMARAREPITRICRKLRISPELVQRILAGKGIDLEPAIQDTPTIQGVFDKNGWPVDEDATTESIYAAAEAIREKRPRSPQGYPPTTEVPVVRSRLVFANGSYL